MRKLNLGTTELVRGMITDLQKNDLTVIKDLIELAVTPDEVTDAPLTGYTPRDAVSMIGRYTVLPEKSYTAVERGRFKLWAHWANPPEDVYLLVGYFLVV